MELQGAASPGLLVLTTGLSKPFRRLEKYAGMLQELERHVEENHPDRGDTQRSVSVYKDIAVSVLFLHSSKFSVYLHETTLLSA
jgi:Rho guanine nucleotide exchange factor 7